MEAQVDGVYRAWMARHEDTIAALAWLNVPLPPSVLWPASHTLNRDWSLTLAALEEPGREHEVHGQLLPLWNRARGLGVHLDSSGAGRRIDERLRREMGSLTEALNETACDRVRALLNIAERFDIELSRSRIEDAFFGLLTGPVTDLYKRYERGDIGEEKSMLLCALGLARRLNFSTERFPVA
jgi:hypothetical protein